MGTTRRHLQLVCLVTMMLVGQAASAHAQALTPLAFNHEECEGWQVDALYFAVRQALDLLMSNRSPRLPFPDNRKTELLKTYFAVDLASTDETQMQWNAYALLILSGYEEIVLQSFLPSGGPKGVAVTFVCTDRATSKAAEVDSWPARILIYLDFWDLELIEQSGTATQAGTILHEMVHVATRKKPDYCPNRDCHPAAIAAEKAAMHDPIIFERPSNYEYFYQDSYPFAPDL